MTEDEEILSKHYYDEAVDHYLSLEFEEINNVLDFPDDSIKYKSYKEASKEMIPIKGRLEKHLKMVEDKSICYHRILGFKLGVENDHNTYHMLLNAIENKHIKEVIKANFEEGNEEMKRNYLILDIQDLDENER